MNARLNMRVDHRASLPLTPRDVADLARLRETASVRTRLSLPDGDLSEAALLHAVLVAGIQCLQDEAEERGYAELAGQYRNSAEGAERHKARRMPARYATD
jgi:hypothetical protein